MNWEIIISLFFGGGAGAALVNAYAKIRSKGMDIALQERKQFIAELNEMRSQINSLSVSQMNLMRENGELKIRIKELESHITHKAEKLKEIKVLVNEYNDSLSNDAQVIFIRKVIELVE